MSTLVLEHETSAENVLFTADALVVALSDGRRVSVPLAWYPRLLHGSRTERAHYELIGNGEGIHWPDLDEDISVEGILAGRPSQEAAASLAAWLKSRKRNAPARKTTSCAARR
jgi:hypothetical protein